MFLGKGASRESSAGCKGWVEAVALFALQQRPAGRTLEAPYDLELEFYMPMPANPKYGWPTRDGDLDKLERAVLDGLTQGRLIVDDRHVVGLSSRKWFSPGKTGAEIRIV